MTRLELLQLVIARARSHGFEFRRWYTSRLDLPWISPEAAAALLVAQRRYYALIFSHEFAQTFWKPGAEISFDVPSQSFERAMPDGTVRTVQRKPFIRRSTRTNAWRYHLQQMAVAEEPLRYLRKFLHIEEDLPSAESGIAESDPTPDPPARKIRENIQPAPVEPPKKRTSRPLPTGTPAFLKRPYRPAPK